MDDIFAKIISVVVYFLKYIEASLLFIIILNYISYSASTFRRLSVEITTSD